MNVHSNRSVNYSNKLFAYLVSIAVETDYLDLYRDQFNSRLCPHSEMQLMQALRGVVPLQPYADLD